MRSQVICDAAITDNGSARIKPIINEIINNCIVRFKPLNVRSAATRTKHIGDLYYLLSNELEGTNKEEFLSLVDGLNI